MPIVLTGLDRAEIRLAASPLIELGSALHVLHSPEHHGRGEWAAAVLERLPTDLRDQLDLWSFTFRAVRARPFAAVWPGPAGVSDWPAERRRLHQMQPADLALALVRPLRARAGPDAWTLTPAQTWERAQRWAAARGAPVSRLVGEARHAPERAVGGFLTLLDECWERFFATEWQHVRPLLAGRVAHGHDLLRRHGPATLLETLVPAMRVDRARGQAVLEKVQSRRVDLSERGLTLMPSTYAAPHVHIGNEPGTPFTLMCPAAVPGAPPPPTATDLLGRLEALAHPVRLRICRAVASEPRSAGEIASLWNLEATQVTKHLRALTRAGIVRADRSGRYVRYRLDDATVRRLGGDVVDLLLR